MCASVRGCPVSRLARECGSVLMMHLLVSNDSGHMVKPRAAGPFDVTELARTHFLEHLHENTHTSAFCMRPHTL